MFQRTVRVCLVATSLASAGMASAQDRPWQKLFGSPPAKVTAAQVAAEQARRLVEIRVELAWLADPITFPYFLDAKTAGNSLAVRGFVPDSKVRGQALKMARLYSPHPVVDNLKEHPALLVRPGKISPQQLNGAVVSALREALPRQHQRIQVQCSAEGTVFLRGQVATAEEKLAAALALRRLYGCTSVQVMLQVPGAPPDVPVRDVALNQDPPPAPITPKKATAAKATPKPAPKPAVEPDSEPDDLPLPRFGLPRSVKDKKTTANTGKKPAEPKVATPAPAPAIVPSPEEKPVTEKPVAEKPLPKPAPGPQETPSAKIISATPMPAPTVGPPVSPPRLGGVENPPEPETPIGPSLLPPTTPEPPRVGEDAGKKKVPVKKLSAAALPKLQMRVIEACPGAKGVKVEILPANKLKIELTVRNDAEIGTFTGSIYNIAELADYRENVELHFVLSEPPAGKR